LFGSVFTHRISPDRLRRAFALLVAAMGTFVVAQQLWPSKN
jgi:uncharacterized membrane protein YfcA